MTSSQLHSREFNSYYQRYIDKFEPNTNLQSGFEIGQQNVVHFFQNIPTDKYDFRYQEGKWSIKEILQHLIDTERIFMYRCFRIARRDLTSLSGFDQNIYIDPSKASEKTLDSLLEEFIINRAHSISLLTSLSDEDLTFIGKANGDDMSARAAAFTILGHEIWHMDVIKEKYL